FSSRRRHTRSYGDWSSDVCSSDLQNLIYQGRQRAGLRATGEIGDDAGLAIGVEQLRPPQDLGDDGPRQGVRECQAQTGIGLLTRSEERRVGKEARSRWGTY